MAPSHQTSVVVIDDDDVLTIDDDNSDCQVSRKSNQSRRQQNSRSTFNDNSPIWSRSRRASYLSMPPPEDLIKLSLENHPQLAFRSPDWASDTKPVKRTSSASADSASKDSRCLPRSEGAFTLERIFSLSPSPSLCPVKSGPGTVGEPIELEEDEDFSDSHKRRESYLLLHDTIDLCDNSIDLLDDPPDPKSALSRSKNRHPAPDDEIMELDDLEDLDVEILEANRGGKISIEDVYEEDPKLLKEKASRAAKFAHRNPSIVAPDLVCDSAQYKNMYLRANKTVQLLDGNLIRIKAVIVNTETQEIRVRGHQLQRTRDLNGILERKMNEVVLLLEVDLDDPRHPLEQDVVEFAAKDILKIRRLRATNQKFPDCRNVQLKDHKDLEDVIENGGLTLRWKYTCTYASAADRHRNVFKERKLERLRADDCLSDFAVPDTARRFKWRGETVRGGAHRPTLAVEKAPSRPETLPGSAIQIEDSPELDCVLVDYESSVRYPSTVVQEFNTIKRKRSLLDFASQDKASFGDQVPKKARYEEDKDGEVNVEKNRRRLSKISLQPRNGSQSRRKSSFVDLTVDESVSNTSSRPSKTKDLLSTAPMQKLHVRHEDAIPSRLSISASSPPQAIDLSDTELSTPPPSGSIKSSTPMDIKPMARSAGQALTYGDAFCGAGGATRGAVMAGLQVLWGFDFSKHACQSWRANFPYARCYEKEAHSFVSEALQAKHRGNSNLMKVDVCHLSPPCQFFSPAHTIDGKDDEMNVASLFAVQSVIAVSKARVVTLEQTFGIICPRFRFYFNALIQMFTANDFSVRWAVIPLAQWGVPQRRNRLIIIASCPGEILPRMPTPTHSDPSNPIPNTRPFVSANSALQSIPRDAPDHNPQDPILQFPPHRQNPPWDGSNILPRAMTTSGGQNYHPSGKRDLTLREYAAMQGFPQVHVFRGNYKKKQIGNAVPPVVAKVLFESVKRDLDDADGIIEEGEVLD